MWAKASGTDSFAIRYSNAIEQLASVHTVTTRDEHARILNTFGPIESH